MTYPTPSNDDFAALDEVKGASESRVSLARTRAEKWIAGLAALLGLVATVLVIKGPDSITKFGTGQRWILAGAIVATFVFLAAGLYNAYAAAYGDALGDEDFDPKSVVGLAERLADARAKAEASVRTKLKNAVQLTVIGIGTLIVTVGITWFMSPPSSAKDVCVYQAGAEITRVSKDVTTPITLTPSGGAIVRPCDT
jgi:hypothetical protein